MLTIIIEGQESYDSESNLFHKDVEDVVLKLEHSLVSLSKWESVYEKPFLDKKSKTKEEVMSYVEMMMLGDYPKGIVNELSQTHFDTIAAYIDSSQSATWFHEQKSQAPSRETITSELVYYWMFSLGIPKECETWHFGRLLTLIRVFNAKQSKPKKQSSAEIAARNRELNARRRQELGTKG